MDQTDPDPQHWYRLILEHPPGNTAVALHAQDLLVAAMAQHPQQGLGCTIGCNLKLTYLPVVKLGRQQEGLGKIKKSVLNFSNYVRKSLDLDSH